MQTYVAIDGREALVEIQSIEEGRLQVTVDSCCYQVDVAPGRHPGVGSSLLIGGQQFEFFSQRVKSQGGIRNYALTVNGRRFTAEVIDPLAHLARESDGKQGAAKVEAYMPGRVVALMVAEGDAVEQGQGVLALEAMKMENEIVAEAAGVVSQLFVKQGQIVETGDALFEVTPR